jgi:hypothetical protein
MERALHTVDVIEAIQTAAATGQHVEISEMPTRPAPLSPDQGQSPSALIKFAMKQWEFRLQALDAALIVRL